MVRIIGSKNKNYIEYVCDKCTKKFNQKNDYLRHINKIKSCKKEMINEQIKNDLENNNKMIIDNENKMIINNEHDDNINMELMKKIDYLIEQNKKINNDILELKEDNKILKEDNKILKEDNKILKEDNKTLKDNYEKLKNQISINNNILQNTNYNNINLNIQINNFNRTDYSKIDKTTLINSLIQEQGKQIYLKAIENLYLDPKKPENHNIYVNDKNRGYAKIYNNGRWETQNINIVDTIINNFVDYYKLSIDEIKADREKYVKIKNFINNKIRFLNFCDLEYLAELEDEQENDDINNKDKIKRCKEFRDMVYRDIINLLHDKKDIVLKTHKSYITTV
jgi:uncharacterized C2H2 Zn-finger protein